MTEPFQVAIDGPAGAGKTSIASRLAEDLGLVHVDTGAMYRGVTLLAQRGGISSSDGPALAQPLQHRRFEFVEGKLRIDGEDVSADIRTPQVTAIVSQVSAHPEVRREMVRLQRRLCDEAPHGAVLEGRDIGSVVLPLARCKIYLDASVEERARRRALQDGLGDEPAAIDRIRKEIAERDQMDREREFSPLLISLDAHVVDTTSIDLDATIVRCRELAEAAHSPPAGPDRLQVYEKVTKRYWCARTILTWVWKLCGMRVHGAVNQNVAVTLIYASNHISWFDPPVVGSSTSRELHFLAKKELFWGPLGWFISAFNAIPIMRGRWDPVAFERAEQTLAEKKSLIIFPEGTRKPIGRPGPVKRGLGVLIEQTGLPFIPCYVAGTKGPYRSLLRLQRMELWFGPPIYPHALPTLVEELTPAELHSRVGKLFLECIRALADRSERAARARSGVDSPGSPAS